MIMTDWKDSGIHLRKVSIVNAGIDPVGKVWINEVQNPVGIQ